LTKALLPSNVKPGAIKLASESLLYIPDVAKEKELDDDTGL
jgi:hypothetical protein